MKQTRLATYRAVYNINSSTHNETTSLFSGCGNRARVYNQTGENQQCNVVTSCPHWCAGVHSSCCKLHLPAVVPDNVSIHFAVVLFSVYTHQPATGNTITFESPDIESSFWVIRYILRGAAQVREYEGHRVKIIEAKTRRSVFPRALQILRSAIT